MYTQEQVIAQENRFESFIASANLVKIGERALKFQFNNNRDGRYNEYVYIGRVLKIIAKVEPSMYKPNGGEFYRSILHREALRSYLDTLSKQ